MNYYLVNILESIKLDDFDVETFIPDEENWNKVELWYNEYGEVEKVSKQELLDLLYFFYIHENLDFYDNNHFEHIAKYICEKFGINKENILKMFYEFRRMLYKD